MPKVKPMPSREALLLSLTEQGSQFKASHLYGISRDLMTTWCRLLKIERGDYKLKRISHPSSKFPGKHSLLASIKKLKTNKAIAEHYGVHVQAVRRWRKLIGDTGVHLLTKEDITLIRELQQYLSANFVAEKFGKAPRTIRDIWDGTTWGWVK